MKTTHIHEGCEYEFSNENLKVGDEVYPISGGRTLNGIYTHEEFDFRDFMSGFPDEHHTIIDLHHSDYKPYECRTDCGYGPIESYFKIISKNKI